MLADGGRDLGSGCAPEGERDTRGDDGGVDMYDRLDRGVDGGEGVGEYCGRVGRGWGKKATGQTKSTKEGEVVKYGKQRWSLVPGVKENAIPGIAETRKRIQVPDACQKRRSPRDFDRRRNPNGAKMPEKGRQPPTSVF